jgi:hypothetical protein
MVLHVVKYIFLNFFKWKTSIECPSQNGLLIYLKGLFKKQFNEKFSQFVLIICSENSLNGKIAIIIIIITNCKQLERSKKEENFYSPTLVLMSERTTSIFMGLLSLFLHPFLSISFLRKTFSEQ